MRETPNPKTQRLWRITFLSLTVLMEALVGSRQIAASSRAEQQISLVNARRKPQSEHGGSSKSTEMRSAAVTRPRHVCCSG